jgi:hypothetical protein
MREKFPLFADQMEEVTGEQVQTAADRHAEAFARCEQELHERGNAFREQVRTLVSAEVLAELDRRRQECPDTPEYHADFWRHQLQALSKRSPSVP